MAIPGTTQVDPYRNESKQTFQARLVKEGRWQAFVARRNEIRMEPGMTKDRARELAVAEFPPLRTSSISEGGEDGQGDTSYGKEDFAEGATDAGAPEENYTVCVKWIAANLDNRDAKPSDAPAPWAWNLLIDARADAKFRTTTFWGNIHAKVAGGRGDEEEEEARKAHDGNILDTIAKLTAISKELQPQGHAVPAFGPEGAESR